MVVVIDFDRTLTKYDALNSWDAVETWPGFSQQYRDRASHNHNKCNFYFLRIDHPMEVDPNVTPQEKGAIMQQWWRDSFDNLIAEKPTKAILRVGIR